MKVRSACGLALVCEISINHLAYQVFESDVVVPVELRARLGAISKQKADLRRTIELLIDDNVIVVVEAYMTKRYLEELPYRVRLSSGDHVVIGRILLKHEPHGSHIVTGVSPVPPSIQVAEPQVVNLPQLDASDVGGDLSGHKLKSAPRTLMIEEDAAGRVEVVRLAIIARQIESSDL